MEISLITLLTLLFALIHLGYWVFIFPHILYSDKGTVQPGKEMVSVVVAIKNEAPNVGQLLEFLLNQDYPHYEVIVVDDFSTDGTLQVLNTYRDERLKVIKASQNLPGKKAALQEGILKASGSIILLTDGDCSGTSGHWISKMAGKMNGRSIVLGYAPLRDHGKLVSLFARFEACLTGIQYLSYAQLGIPYMGVGRNLAFRKSLFTAQGGYAGHLDMASGDDDLFINAAATGENTVVQLDPDTYMYSEAPFTWRRFFRQKRRHLTTATRYKFVHQILLGLFSFTFIMMYLGAITGFCLPDQPTVLIFLAALLIRWLMAVLLMRKLREGKLLFWFPVFDLCLFFYYLIMAPFTVIQNKETWK